MRILVATEHLAIIGGVETYLRSLLPALIENGHDVAVLTQQVSQTTFSILDRSPSIFHWSLDEGMESTFQKVCDWQPEVCYLHGFTNPEVDARISSTFPSLFFVHNYYGTCISGTKRFSFPTPMPCHRRFGTRCLALYFPRRCGGLNPRVMLQLYQTQNERNGLLQTYAGIAVASQSMYQEMIRHGIGKERLHLLPLYPTDQKPDLHAPQQRPFQNHLIVLGRLTELKGTHLLLRSIPDLEKRLQRRLKCTIAGEGVERHRLERLAQRLKLKVHFSGWVSSESRQALMRSADLLVMPGTWPEPFGLVGIEAGCVGLPTVAFRVGGIPDWCRDGESGILAEGDPPCVRSLTDALFRALKNQEFYHSLRIGAWKVSQEFTKDRHLNQLQRILHEVAILSPDLPK